MVDNTSAMGWMQRSNFRSQYENEREWFSKLEVSSKMTD